MKAYDPRQHTKAENDNRSNQLNPNNQAYWSSRGFLLSDEDEEDERWGGTMPCPHCRRTAAQRKSGCSGLRPYYAASSLMATYDLIVRDASMED